MIRKVYLAGTAAVALLMVTPTMSSAAMLPAGKPSIATSENLVQVRKGGGRHFRGGRHFGRSFGRHRGFGRQRGYYRGHRRGGFGIYIGPSYRYGNCGWLRRKAVRTGSSYWWRRYRACAY